MLAPQHPHTVRIASISAENLTMQWPHDPSSCTAACSYLVRYQQTSPYNYNSYPVTELPVSCPGLLPAQPARSTSPNAMNTCTGNLRDLIPGALYDIDVYASSYNVLSVTAAQLRQRTRESLLNVAKSKFCTQFEHSRKCEQCVANCVQTISAVWMLRWISVPSQSFNT